MHKWNGDLGLETMPIYFFNTVHVGIVRALQEGTSEDYWFLSDIAIRENHINNELHIINDEIRTDN